MPVKTEDRPVKNIREEAIDQLVMNYGHDEITLEAFETEQARTTITFSI